MRRFSVWLEDKLAERKLKHSLLDALGLAKDALDAGNDVPLRTIDKARLIQAISNIGLNQAAQEALANYARSTSHGGTLKAMLATINPEDLEQQDVDTSSPAVIPPSQQPMPKPTNRWQNLQKQQQQTQQPMGL